MCQIFAGQAPANYRQVTRSFRLHGHATSVRLESKVWEIIDEIAIAQALTTPQFLARIHDEVEQQHGRVRNFASLLRCACLLYLEQPQETLGHAARELERDAGPHRLRVAASGVLAG